MTRKSGIEELRRNRCTTSIGMGVEQPSENAYVAEARDANSRLLTRSPRSRLIISNTELCQFISETHEGTRTLSAFLIEWRGIWSIGICRSEEIGKYLLKH